MFLRLLHESTNLGESIESDALLPTASPHRSRPHAEGHWATAGSRQSPAAACASPRSLGCCLPAWHRLPGPPMETSRTPLPIGCQCLSPDPIAGSQFRTAAGGERGRKSAELGVMPVLSLFFSK